MAEVKTRAGLFRVWMIIDGGKVKMLSLASIDSRHLWAVATAAATPAAAAAPESATGPF